MLEDLRDWNPDELVTQYELDEELHSTYEDCVKAFDWSWLEESAEENFWFTELQLELLKDQFYLDVERLEMN